MDAVDGCASRDITMNDASNFLPTDGCVGTLVGRAWLPGAVPGPAVIALRDDGVYDLSAVVSTVSSLIERGDPAKVVQRTPGRRIGSIEELLDNSVGAPDESKPYLLAPCDLQVVKAAGVTFAASMLERVIEEQTRGDPSRAVEVRSRVRSLIGDDLSAVVPGSAEAMKLKALLLEQGLWSQYLEVGIGPDAEVFTKAPVLAAVGRSGFTPNPSGTIPSPRSCWQWTAAASSWAPPWATT